jgi:hypothetical protein
MYFNVFAKFTAGLVVLLLIAFGLLQWLHINAGSFLDWVIGGATFWWLMVIVTVPWNVYFQAKEVLAEAEESQAKEIKIDRKKLDYVQTLAKRSLPIALLLHILSAIGLYTLAITGISAVGYVGSGAALLLTGLRPAVRAYEYISARLGMVRQEFLYPRQDMWELRGRVEMLEMNLQTIQEEFNLDNPQSVLVKHSRNLEAMRHDLTQVAAGLESLKSTNQAQHEQLAKESQNAIAQITEDGQFLNHVREIIRFFKQA